MVEKVRTSSSDLARAVTAADTDDDVVLVDVDAGTAGVEGIHGDSPDGPLPRRTAASRQSALRAPRWGGGDSFGFVAMSRPDSKAGLWHQA